MEKQLKLFIEKKSIKVTLSVQDIKEYSLVFSIQNVILVQELAGSHEPEHTDKQLIFDTPYLSAFVYSFSGYYLYFLGCYDLLINQFICDVTVGFTVVINRPRHPVSQKE